MSRKLYGGDIKKANVYKYIRSIGFELESANMFKLTKHEGKYFNLNTNRKVLSDYKINDDNHTYNMRFDLIDIDIDNISLEDYEAHKKNCEEKKKCIYVKEYIQENIEDNPNWFFEITNDASENNDLASLLMYDKGCVDNENPFMHKYELLTYESRNPTRTDLISNKEKCGIFDEAEWVYTYYTLENQSRNTILQYLKKTIDHLYEHLHSHDNGSGKYANVLIKHKNDTFLSGLPKHKLYEFSDKNMAYLLVNNNDKYNTKNIQVDDMLITIQTTLGIKIEHAYLVYSQLASQKEFENPTPTYNMDYNKDNIEIPYEVVRDLFKDYNSKRENTMKFVYMNPSGLKPEKKKSVEHKNLILKRLHYYLFLIFYKVRMYLLHYEKIEKYLINHDDQEEGKATFYFKNAMAFNHRHKTSQIYDKIIECIQTYLQLNDRMDAVEILHKLINNPDQLDSLYADYYKDGFISDGYTTDLDQGDENYGNPYYSFFSYFKHFEVNEVVAYEEWEQEGDIDEAELMRKKEISDWLTYANIDMHTDNLPIKDDVIIVEMRLFPKLIVNYVKDNTRNALSIGSLYDLFHTYRYKSNSKTRRIKSKSKSRKLSKTILMDKTI